MQRSGEDVRQTRARQTELYGEPLHDVLGRCAYALHLTQAKMSEYLGISAPMLSQLINGHRIKIGNPAAAQRLQRMIQIARHVESGDMSLDEAYAQLQRNAASHDVLAAAGNSRRTRHLGIDIQEICRATAAASEFIEAANLLRSTHPEIAQFLIIYGAERADRAVEHTDRLRGR